MAGFYLPGPWEIMLIMFWCVVPAVIMWRICSKAGYPGALGLLVLVPIVNLILLIFLAFAKWPIERELEGYKHSSGPEPAPQ
jgi:hypothetical protein